MPGATPGPGAARRQVERADLRVILLRQRGCTEAGRRAGSQCESVREVVTRGERTGGGVAEVVVVLVAHGDRGAQFVREIGFKAHVLGDIAAAPRAGIDRAVTAEALRAATYARRADVIGTRIASADAVRIAQVLRTERERHRVGQPADIQILGDIHIHRLLRRRDGAVEETRGRVAEVVQEGVVRGVDRVQRHAIATVVRAYIPTPAVRSYRARRPPAPDRCCVLAAAAGSHSDKSR